MAQRKLSILFAGGIDNRTVDELVAPTAQQGTAPALKVSRNVRLGVNPGGIARSPAFASVTTPWSQVRKTRGFVSSSAGRNTLALPGPTIGIGGSGLPQVIADGGRVSALDLGAVGSSGNQRARQAGAMPVRVKSSVAVPGTSCSQVALGYNATSNLVLCAYTTNVLIPPLSGPDFGLTVAYRSVDGVTCTGPARIAVVGSTIGGAYKWVGVTCHGANGDRVWYIDASSRIVYQAIVNGDYGAEVSGSPVVVVTPGLFAEGNVDVVASADGTHAYLVHSRSGTPADGTVRKVNVTNGSTASSFNLTNALLGGGFCAVTCATLSGVEKVATSFASTTNVTARCDVWDASISVAVSASTVACRGRVAVAFQKLAGSTSGGPFVSWLVEENAVISTAVSRNEPVCRIRLIKTSDGTVQTSSTHAIPWTRIAGKSAQWLDSGQAGDVLAIHQLVPRHALTLEQPGEANYCDDPSLDLFWVKDVTPAPLARLGVVRGSHAPVDHLYAQSLASANMLAVGDELLCAYRLLQIDVRDTDSAFDTTSRLTTLSLGDPVAQLSYAHDAEGPGMLAGALPLYWDGAEVSELGAPTRTPILKCDKIASGTAPAAGVYGVQAVLYWRDAAGLTHRSRPSKLVSLTLNGSEGFEALIGNPWSLVPNQMWARLYVTGTNGTQLLLEAIEIYPSGTYGAGFQESVTSSAAIALAGPSQIYSSGGNGEEIVPQPPPPAHDIQVIGPRCWIIDAEHRSRLVPSKLRIAGVGYEFAPGLEVIVPAGAGKLVAVREWRGTPVALTERAVYTISGDGPNNTLGGSGAWYPPAKLADIGCTNEASVVVCPAGILWQSHNRFVLLNDGGVAYIDKIACSHDVSAAVCLRRHSEVLFFSSTTTEVRAYHYDTGRWSTYDSQTLSGLVQAAHTLPYDPDSAVLAVYEGSTPLFRRVDADSISAATNAVFETDWLLLGGDFQDDVVVSALVFNGKILGAHDIKLELFVDYQSTPATSRTWDLFELDAIDVEGLYSVKLEPTFVSCRAVKLRVTDTRVVGGGCAPRSATLYYELAGAIREDAFSPGAFK